MLCSLIALASSGNRTRGPRTPSRPLLPLCYGATNTNTNNDDDDADLIPLRSEVEKAIRGLKNNKAAGCDEIPAELLKGFGENGVTILHKLCVKIWKTGSWPTDWSRTMFMPLPKKGDLQLCSNYRTISLISHASKIMLKLLINRLSRHIEREISETQAGFRSNKGTRQQIFNLKILLQKCREYNVDVHMCFVDYSKAFDCVKHKELFIMLREMGFPARIVTLLKSLYGVQQSCVKTSCGISDWFRVSKGVRQGCPVSPSLFNAYTVHMERGCRRQTI